jgi:hypothetical protein
MAAAGALLREFAERSLLPRVEERMARLNLAVSTARKGLKNRLTRLWKGAAAEPGPSMVGCSNVHVCLLLCLRCVYRQIFVCATVELLQFWCCSRWFKAPLSRQKKCVQARCPYVA